MTSSFDRMGGMRARAKEASSHLGNALRPTCLTDQLIAVAQMFGVALSLQEPPATPLDCVTAALNLISHGYQLYRMLKDG
ncbi:hypothetical protein [Streptomyces sp. PsTaAH-124]|uniref:hypothetical protein n=1 Tax=Streptomyces sp. PsTaAH-124 TaxID=1157638 RepID=UPI00036C1CB4|nr:hypothetical protein [Streptomyces sp. PsTaAH-124]